MHTKDKKTKDTFPVVAGLDLILLNPCRHVQILTPRQPLQIRIPKGKERLMDASQRLDGITIG
jgi:hypothetical protein